MRDERWSLKPTHCEGWKASRQGQNQLQAQHYRKNGPDDGSEGYSSQVIESLKKRLKKLMKEGQDYIQIKRTIIKANFISYFKGRREGPRG